MLIIAYLTFRAFAQRELTNYYGLRENKTRTIKR